MPQVATLLLHLLTASGVRCGCSAQVAIASDPTDRAPGQEEPGSEDEVDDSELRRGEQGAGCTVQEPEGRRACAACHGDWRAEQLSFQFRGTA